MKLKENLLAFVIGFTFAVHSIPAHGQNAFVHNWSIGYYGFNVDAPVAICTDSRSNVYTVGYFEDSVDMDTVSTDRELWSHGLRDGYINKLDSSGNPVWSLAVGGSSLDQCSDIIYDGNGNLYISGTFTGTVDFDPGSGVFNLTSAGQYDAFLIKLDTNGVFSWALRWGDWSSDVGGKILVGASSDIYLLGSFDAIIDLDPSSGVQMTTSPGGGTFIVKLSTSGSFAWGGDYTASQTATAVLDGNGFIYLSGTCTGVNCDMDPGAGIINFSTAGNTDDIFVIKMTIAGNYVWHKTIGNTSIDRGYSIGVDVGGDIYISGLFRGNVDFDPGAGSFMMNAGFTIDAYLCRLDTAGNFIHAVSFASGTEDIERCYTIQDADGYFYLMGIFTDGVDFDPSAATFTLTSLGGTLDIYYACLDSALNFVWASVMEGTGNQTTGDFCLDPQGNIVSTHPLSGDVDTDMSAGTDIVNEYNNRDIFVVRMVRTVPLSANITEQSGRHFAVFPNPCSSFLSLEFTDAFKVQAIHIFDVNGSEVEVSFSATQTGMILNMSSLPSGVYFITCESEHEVFHEKVVHHNY